VGFAYIISDAAFGNLKAREHTNFDKIRVGDIIRLDNDSHSVIVLEIDQKGVTIAEGNYNSKIHWGRKLTMAQVKRGNYVTTRYPE
jgi:hypothetical protein